MPASSSAPGRSPHLACAAAAAAAVLAAAAAAAAPHAPHAYADVYSDHGFYAEYPQSWTVADAWESDARVVFGAGGGSGGGGEPGTARVVVSLLDGYEVAARDGGTEYLRADIAGSDLLDALVQSSRAACQQNVHGSCWFYELEDSKLTVVGGVQAASLRFSATVDDREVVVREVVVPAGGGAFWSVRGTAGDGGPVADMESLVSAFQLEGGGGGAPGGGGGAPGGYSTGPAESAASGEVLAQTAGGSCGSQDRDRHAGSNVIPADPSIVLERALSVNLILVGQEWSAYDISVLRRELPSYCDPVVTGTGEKVGMRYLYEYGFVSRPDASGLVEVMDANSAERPLFEAGGKEANTWLAWWVSKFHPSWVADGFAGGRPGEPEYRLVDALAVEEYLHEEVIASDPGLADPASANLVFLAADPEDVGYLYNYRLDGFDRSTDKRFEYVGLMGYGGVHNMQFFDLYAAPWIDIDIKTFKYDEPDRLHSLHDCGAYGMSDDECFYDAASFHVRSALSHIVTPSFVYPVEHHERYLVDVLVYTAPGGAATITPASLKYLVDEEGMLAELEYLYPHAEWSLETSVERRDLRGLSLDFKDDLEKGRIEVVEESAFGPERQYRILDSEDLRPHLLRWASERVAERGADAGTRVIPVLVVVGSSDAELAIDEIGVLGYAPPVPDGDGDGGGGAACCAFAVTDESDVWSDGIGLSDLILHEVGHVLGLHHPFLSFDIYGAPHNNGYYNWYASPMTYSMPSLSTACGYLYAIAYDRPCGNPLLSFTAFERDRLADARLASLYKRVGGGEAGGQPAEVRALVDESMERFRTGDVLSARGALQKMADARAAAESGSFAGDFLDGKRQDAAGAPAAPPAAPAARGADSEPPERSAAAPERPAVPEWVKNSAGWWADGMITDSDFVNGIGFLIDTGVIDIGPAGAGAAPERAGQPPAGGAEAQVPGWVKMSAGWWADGMISEAEFVRGMEFLVSEGVIRTGR